MTLVSEQKKMDLLNDAITYSETIFKKQKRPSNELVSLFKEFAEGFYALGNIWNRIKTKGAEEGFSEDELRVELRKSIKARFPDITPGQLKDRVYYLTHVEERKEKADKHRPQNKKVETVSTNDEPEPEYTQEQKTKFEEIDERACREALFGERKRGSKKALIIEYAKRLEEAGMIKHTICDHITSVFCRKEPSELVEKVMGKELFPNGLSEPSDSSPVEEQHFDTDLSYPNEIYETIEQEVIARGHST